MKKIFTLFLMRNNSCLLLTCLLVVVLIGCQDEISQEEHRQALIDTREEWVNAIREGDVEKIFSFWTNDVVIYPVSESAVKGIDEVREYVRRNRQDLGLAPRMTPIKIAVSESGDFGFVVGTHEWINLEGQATMPGRYVSMWRKDNQGEWRCFLEIHSPRPVEEADTKFLFQEKPGADK